MFNDSSGDKFLIANDPLGNYWFSKEGCLPSFYRLVRMLTYLRGVPSTDANVTRLSFFSATQRFLKPAHFVIFCVWLATLGFDELSMLMTYGVSLASCKWRSSLSLCGAFMPWSLFFCLLRISFANCIGIFLILISPGKHLTSI